MIRIVPSDEVPWEDVEAIFDGSEPGKCHCQRYKVKGWMWRDSTLDERVAVEHGHALPPNRSARTSVVSCPSSPSHVSTCSTNGVDPQT